MFKTEAGKDPNLSPPDEADGDDGQWSGGEDEEESEAEEEEEQTSEQGQVREAKERSIAPPQPLFYERDGTSWDDFIDDSPKTGQLLKLKPIAPPLLCQESEEEALVEVRDKRLTPGEMDMIMGKVSKKGVVSETGYPVGLAGKLVYDSVTLNARRLVTPKADDDTYYHIQTENDTTLIFESLFESGNLYQAYQVAEFEYELVLKNDFNTNGHTQWYFFSVGNTRKDVTYKFTIVNLYKRTSMYSKGLKPLLHSEKEAKTRGRGWHRAGFDISYHRNDYQYSKRSIVRNFYSLQFSLQFPHGNDICYLAHCFPYTYSDLQQYIRKLESDVDIRKIFRRKLLCRSIAGNRCEVLTITDPREVTGEEAEAQKKQCVVLSARVHPGETNSSWMMHGCIDFLLSSHEEAKKLRQQFVFKIVPMINPDGVIIGNYRTGMAGNDLNRKWKNPCPTLQPTIHHMKEMMARMRDERGIALFVDLHGHSVKKNVFIYGCDSKYWEDGENHATREKPKALEARLFPAVLEDVSPQFNFQDCRFHVKRRKETSGRVVVWRQFTDHSYTMEASFGGADQEHEPRDSHFGIQHYKAMGESLCRAMASLWCSNESLQLEEFQEKILKQVESCPLPEDDSDDENEAREDSSDDGSDDDTVLNPILPKLEERTSKKPNKSKKAKTKGPKSVKKDDKQERNAKTMSPARRDANRSEDARQARGVELRANATGRGDLSRDKHERSELGSAKCSCPACQVYEEFLSTTVDLLQTTPNKHVGLLRTARSGSSSSSPRSVSSETRVEGDGMRGRANDQGSKRASGSNPRGQRT